MMIHLIPNFLPSPLFADLVQNEPAFHFGWKSHLKTDPTGHAIHDYAETQIHNLAHVADRLPLPLTAAWEACTGHSPITQAHRLLRAYQAGHAYGMDGHVHTDSDSLDQLTIVLFLNATWNLDWAGELVFVQDGAITQSILPSPNQAVIFPSHWQHVARGISRCCPVTRRTLIFKCRPARSLDFERLSAFLYQHGATNQAHAKGSLHDHLMRTYQLLEDKKLPKDVCLAGGLHSTLGTKSYKQALFADDSPIIANFGAEVAGLVQDFRNSAPNRWIEAANLLDQGLLNRHIDLQALWHSA